MAKEMYNDISQDYFEWLMELAGLKDYGGFSYWLLSKDLHSIDFTWSIELDENRNADGKSLREDYFYDCDFPSEEFDEILYRENASVLEVLVALARRMDFEMSDPDDPTDKTADFFFEMLENLGLDQYDDENYYDLGGESEVCHVIDIWLRRAYKPDGRGGLFPLACPDDDQRDIQIWYQMMAYLEENH